MSALNNEIIPTHAKTRIALFDVAMGKHYLTNDFCIDGAVLYGCEAFTVYGTVRCIEYWRNNLYYQRWYQMKNESVADFTERVMSEFGYNLNYEIDAMHEYREF